MDTSPPDDDATTGNQKRFSASICVSRPGLVAGDKPPPKPHPAQVPGPAQPPPAALTVPPGRAREPGAGGRGPNRAAARTFPQTCDQQCGTDSVTVDADRVCPTPLSESKSVEGTSRLRILMTTEAGGTAWTCCLALASELAAHGTEVTLAVLGRAPDAAEAKAAEAVAGLRFMHIPILPDEAATPGAIEKAATAIGRFASVIEADLIHLHRPELGGFGALRSPFIASASGCAATRWQALGEAPLPEELVWQREATRRAYGEAAAVVAPTQAFADLTAATYGLSHTPAVVPFGLPPLAAVESPGGLTDFAFTAVDPQETTPVSACDLATLNGAAARIAVPVLAAGPSAGTAPDAPTFGHLWLLGALEPAERARWLRAAPVFVTASRYEPFGLPVLEAAQAGCALVLSDIPAHQELWDGIAYFAPPGDEAAFAAAIEELVGDTELCASLGELAAERAQALTPAASAEAIAALYRSVLDR